MNFSCSFGGRDAISMFLTLSVAKRLPCSVNALFASAKNEVLTYTSASPIASYIVSNVGSFLYSLPPNFERRSTALARFLCCATALNVFGRTSPTNSPTDFICFEFLIGTATFSMLLTLTFAFFNGPLSRVFLVSASSPLRTETVVATLIIHINFEM